MANLLTGFQIDDIFHWPKGRCERLARRGRLPYTILPDGKSIRFDLAEIERLARHVDATPPPAGQAVAQAV